MYKRIVIKVGTKVLTNTKGELDESIVEHLVAQIVTLQENDCEVILVSSGAMGAGRAILKNGSQEETPAEKQVFAAVGQVALMNAYAKYLKRHNVELAQILVTKEDFRDRTHYQNMETCFTNILRKGVLPIVNENDVVAVKELLFTDNDELTSLIALQLDAEAVFILTSVDGVIAGNLDDANAKVVPTISTQDISAIEKHITPEKTGMGRGGMLTKFAMARKLMSAGITVYFLNGKNTSGIRAIFSGKSAGTQFIASKKVSARKRKLAHGDSLARGEIVINKCLEDRLMHDSIARSILPVGVLSSTGAFEKGDVVSILNENGNVVGCGIAKFGSETLKTTIGTKGGRPIIHYDDLFILN